jgi:hypothetical protein
LQVLIKQFPEFLKLLARVEGTYCQTWVIALQWLSITINNILWSLKLMHPNLEKVGPVNVWACNPVMYFREMVPPLTSVPSSVWCLSKIHQMLNIVPKRPYIIQYIRGTKDELNCSISTSILRKHIMHIL